MDLKGIWDLTLRGGRGHRITGLIDKVVRKRDTDSSGTEHLGIENLVDLSG